MNARISTLVTVLGVLFASTLAIAQPIGTSFTYQGRLKQGGLPANAPVDLQFSLYDAASGGAQAGGTICRDNIPVADGLFTVSLDFGPQFTGIERFLQIGVRPAGGVGDCGTGSYTPLNARQRVEGVPYAQWSNLGGGGNENCCEPRVDVTTLPNSSTALHVISQPGSYVLREDITGVAGMNGIEINANGVTLDLNGFAIVGVTGSNNGIKMTSIRSNVVIRNGQIRNWGGSGIAAEIDNGRIDHLTSVKNGAWGIDNTVVGSFTMSSRIEFCEAADNGDAAGSGGGIRGGQNSILANCVSVYNTGNGIDVGAGSSVTRSSAASNSASGIAALGGALIESCTSTSNSDDGISTAAGCTVSSCNANSNLGFGIITNAGCTVTGCNATGNGDTGISVSIYSIVSTCTAISNDNNGIFASDGGEVRHSVAGQNQSDGIRVTSHVLVLNNTCSGNGAGGDGAGILVDGFHSRIEGNDCSQCDRGIEVNFDSNLIIRNTCSANTTNWVIASQNDYGPIIHLQGISVKPAVNGNSAVQGTLGANPNDPNANFTY